MPTCNGCTATWTGTSPCHCAACHQTWSGIGLFDKHRSQYGDRGACLTPEALIQRGEVIEYRQNAWRAPAMTDEQKLARFGDRGAA